MYTNQWPAAIRQGTIDPQLPLGRPFAPTFNDMMRDGVGRSERIGLGLISGPNASGQLALNDVPRVIGAAEEAEVGAGLFEGADLGAIAGVEMGPLGILAGGLGGAAIAGGGLMLGGSMFHNADHGRSAHTVSAQHLAHQAGMENQPKISTR